MAEVSREKRDLVLPPGTYAYLQDTTKGGVKVCTGPTVVNQTTQEAPVIYNEKIGTFENVPDLERALRKSVVMPEGFYANLLNPSKQRNQPNEGSTQNSAELDIGRKIVVPGPAMFSLWPGQVAEVIRGHHLRSNQFLLVRIYNEDEAKKNWSKAVVKPASPPSSTGDGTQTGPTTQTAPAVTSPPPEDLTVGKLLIIRGTDVSFYIPSTGITVVPDGVDANGKAIYVREALTLERLEYAILVDENGEKRYANGPSVVFPEPTEKFLEAKNDNGQSSKKFRAIELNELQGIHLKVIADYTEKGVSHKAGEELFITGKDTQIYYPREEHSAIKYDGKTKHFATAVPKGEARYVLNRMTGDIRTVPGPAMLLPDPRSEVIVRRILSDKQASLWYPGNNEALEYNRNLRQVLTQVPTTRGAPSEGDVSRNLRGKFGDQSKSLLASNAVIADSSSVSKEQGYVGDEFVRASNFTQPRTLTLDTKFQGVPVVEVWTGYAVMVVDKSGNRRVVEGPASVLLNYDESFEMMELSTGKPKTTDSMLRTVFLRVANNQVADTVRVETSDHVQIETRLSYRVNFEGDSAKWWNVENYVKFLCDRVRSILKGAVRKLSVEEFYANSTDILQKLLLGDVDATGKRSGMQFEENGMHLTDVEVLGVQIADEAIRQLLDRSQTDVVRTNIELSTLHRNLDVVKEKETVSREDAEVRALTQKRKNELQIELAASELAFNLARLGNDLQSMNAQVSVAEKRQALLDSEHDSELARQKSEADQTLALKAEEQNQRIAFLKAETETIVGRFQAAQGGFSEALLALSHNETLKKVAESWGIQRIIGGDSVSEALQKVFAGSPVEGLMKKLTAAPAINGTTSQVSPQA